MPNQVNRAGAGWVQIPIYGRQPSPVWACVLLVLVEDHLSAFCTKLSWFLPVAVSSDHCSPPAALSLQHRGHTVWEKSPRISLKLYNVYCVLSLCLSSHSWRTEVDSGNLCLAGSDCLPLSYCSESPWDVSVCPSDWQVSYCVFSAAPCWLCFPFVWTAFSLLSNTHPFLCPAQVPDLCHVCHHSNCY